MRFLSVLASLMLALASAPLCASPGDCNDNGVPDASELSRYQLDDGSQEVSVSIGFDADVILLNEFTVTPGAELVRFVTIAWPVGAGGRPSTVLVYADPTDDGDPNDALLVSSSATVSLANDGDDLHVVAVPEAVVGPAGSRFFVGVVLTANEWEAVLGADSDEPYKARSWAALSDPGTAVIEDLSQNPAPLELVGDLCCNVFVNWIMRADPDPPTGVPPDCAVPGDADQNGVVNVVDLLVVLLNWGACDAPPILCPGDLNGDGSVDVQDLTTVLTNWS